MNAGERRPSFGEYLRHALRPIDDNAVVPAVHDDVRVSDRRRFRRRVKALLTRVKKGVELKAAFHPAFIVQDLLIRIVRRAFPLCIVRIQRFVSAAEHDVLLRPRHHIAQLAAAVKNVIGRPDGICLRLRFVCFGMGIMHIDNAARLPPVDIRYAARQLICCQYAHSDKHLVRAAVCAVVVAR